MSLESVLRDLEELAVEELPAVMDMARAFYDAHHAGLTREQAIEAARAAAKKAIDAYEDARLPKG